MDDVKKLLHQYKVDYSVFGQNQGDSIWIERSDFRSAAKVLLDSGYVSSHYSVFKVEQGLVVSLFFSGYREKFNEQTKSALFVLRMSIDNDVLPSLGGLYSEVETHYANKWKLKREMQAVGE